MSAPYMTSSVRRRTTSALLWAFAAGGIAIGLPPPTALEAAEASSPAAVDHGQRELPPHLRASRVTLKMSGAAPRDALAELNRRVGSNLRPLPAMLWSSRTWSPIDVDLENVSFWTALRTICSASGLTLQRGGADELFVRQGTARLWTDFPAVEYGPFLIVAEVVQRMDQVDLSDPDNVQRSCLISMRVFSEPRVRVLRGGTHAVVDEAVDDRGQRVAMEAPAGMGATEPIRPWSGMVRVQLVPPSQAGGQLAVLKGHVNLVVQTASQVVEIPLQWQGTATLTPQVTHTAGGLRLTLREVRRNGETYTAAMRVEKVAAGALDWMDEDLTYMVRMVDAQERPLSRRGGIPRASDMSVTFGREDYGDAEGAAEATKLVWEVPTEVQQVRVPFQFSQIPIE